MLPRWVKVGMVAAVVLTAVGYLVKPYANDWWLASRVCGGAMPDEAVDKLIPDGEHLDSDYEYFNEELGVYSCSLIHEDSYRAKGVSALAHTDRDSQDLAMKTVFYDGTARSVGALPEGLPGFTDEGRVRLLVSCPDLGKDMEGRPRRLLVRTSAEREAMEGQPDALLRTAVALANQASKKLGCGAEPLKAPKHALPGESKPVALSALAGTACSWLAAAKLPTGAGWTVRVAANDAAPVSRCELHRDGEERPRLVFNAWYGDWSEGPFSEAAARHGSSAADGWKTRPVLTANWGRAKARCDAEAANFEAGADEDAGIRAPQLRALLTAFAQDQVKRHGGCKDLALPTRELPAAKR